MTVRRILYKFYWSIEQRIVPGLRPTQYAYFETLLRVLRKDDDWLDLGCGHQVFGGWMMREQAQAISACRHIYGMDLDWNGLRAHAGIRDKIYGNLGQLPVRSCSVDIVTANMVIEHLENPAGVLREVGRVLRPGGRFVFHTPNYRSPVVRLGAWVPERLKKPLIALLEGREGHDVFQTHYRLNTASAVRAMAAETGFAVATVDHVSNAAATTMLGPIVILELLYIRMLTRRGFAHLRTNLICVLEKTAGSQAHLPAVESAVSQETHQFRSAEGLRHDY
jgi:ubiquinone/menaquinone biosynthesis C-methylase UbiE